MKNVETERHKARESRQKAQAERRQIMRAAYRLVGRGDSGMASVQEILDEAGVATRAFYRQFATKDDLIVAMYREEAEQATVSLAARVAQADGPLVALEAWADHWLSMAYEPQKIRRVRALSSAEVLRAVGFRRAALESLSASITILTQILLAGQHAGLFGTVEPQEDARAMQAVVQGLLDTQTHRESGLSWDEAREHTLSLFFRIVGAQAS